MKTTKIFGVALSILFSTAVLAQEKSTSIKVSGNCSMCKRKIENAAKTAGATSINWDSNKQAALVTFDPVKVSIDTIQKQIAGVGYDTEKFKADDKAYGSLPGCCQYERVKLEANKPNSLK